jgi:hypothetical protein
MIEAEPDAPAMMIESYWKNERRDEKRRQDALMIETEYDQKEDVDCQNHKLSRDDVDQNCPDKETRLAHKERIARWAMMSYFERTLNN